RDGQAGDELHHEIRPATPGRAAVQHLGDVGVIHQRQRLAFGFEAGDDLPGVHAQLDDLEGDLADDRLALFGHVNHAHAAFGNLFQQLESANDGARTFRYGRVGDD